MFIKGAGMSCKKLKEDEEETESKFSSGRLEQDEINKSQSSRMGLSGFLENLMRRFQDLLYLVLISPIALVFAICIGVSVAPGIFFYNYLSAVSENYPLIVHTLFCGLGIGLGFVFYILTIIFIVPLFNFFLPLKVQHYRGPWISIPAIPWFIHNALTYLVRYTALDFITPSPLNILFYKMMGMKIGKGVLINSSNISDPCLITLDDYVTIGGSATLMAHYGMKGYLIIDKLHIKKKTTIGLNANILGGVTIGENCTISPGAAVLPKTVLEDGSVV